MAALDALAAYISQDNEKVVIEVYTLKLDITSKCGEGGHQANPNRLHPNLHRRFR